MKKLILTALTLGASMLMSMPVLAAESGWVKEHNDWYYLNNGTKLESTWVKSEASGLWYFLDEDGKMATNTFINNDEKILEDEPSSYHDDYYYVNKDGVMVTNWYDVDCEEDYSSPSSDRDTNWYYFGKDGKMVREEWIQSEYSGLWYAVDEDGKMFKNSIVYNDIEKEKGSLYYVNKDGAMITGWYKTTEDDTLFEEDSWIYADNNGKLIKEGWKKINGSWFCFGKQTITEVSEDRVIAATSSNATIDYQMIDNALVEDNGKTYYVDEDGYMRTGLEKFDDGTDDYYLYFNEKGVLEKGDETLNDGEYKVIKTYDKERIAIGKDSKVILDGYAYTYTKKGEIFTIVDKVKDIPTDCYYYKLGTNNSISKR